MKILIIKLGALGDVINTFPLVVNLKRHLACEIHWLVAPLSYSLVADHQSVDKSILFDKKQGLQGVLNARGQIRETTYDLVLDLQRILKSGFFTLAAKGIRKIGFDKDRCKEMSWIFPFERICPSDAHKHMLDQYMDFAGHLYVDKEPIKWHIPRYRALDKIVRTLPKQYLVLNIGASKRANLWPPDYFAQLSRHVQDQFALPCVLTGGPEDQKAGKGIQEKGAVTILNLTGKTAIHELVEVLAHAEIIVTCDTGPMHLASALGSRVIALFGPSNPERTGPYKGIVIQKNMECSPCKKKICDQPRCMESITPEDVMIHLRVGLKKV